MPLFDLAPTVLALSSGSYTVTRRTQAPYVNGRAAPPTTTTLTITASVQPASGLVVRRLPEGKRNREAMTIYTPTELRPAIEGTQLPDLLSLDGFTFEVESVQRWDKLGNFFECVALKAQATP